MSEVITTILEEGIRLIGLATLKVVTIGRYRTGGEPARLVEGATGVGVIAVTLGLLYYW